MLKDSPDEMSSALTLHLKSRKYGLSMVNLISAGCVKEIKIDIKNIWLKVG